MTRAWNRSIATLVLLLIGTATAWAGKVVTRIST